MHGAVECWIGELTMNKYKYTNQQTYLFSGVSYVPDGTFLCKSMFTLNCSIHKHRDIMRICPIASLATHLISWLLSKIVQLKSDVSHKRDILILNKSHYKLNSQLARRIEVIFSWPNYRRPNSQNYGAQFKVEIDSNT